MKSTHRIKFEVFDSLETDREFLEALSDGALENRHQENEFIRRLLLTGYAVKGFMPEGFMESEYLRKVLDVPEGHKPTELSLRLNISFSSGDYEHLDSKVWREIQNRRSRKDRKTDARKAFIRKYVMIGFLMENPRRRNSPLKEYVASMGNIVPEVKAPVTENVVEKPAEPPKPQASELLGNLVI